MSEGWDVARAMNAEPQLVELVGGPDDDTEEMQIVEVYAAQGEALDDVASALPVTADLGPHASVGELLRARREALLA